MEVLVRVSNILTVRSTFRSNPSGLKMERKKKQKEIVMNRCTWKIVFMIHSYKRTVIHESIECVSPLLQWNVVFLFGLHSSFILDSHSKSELFDNL